MGYRKTLDQGTLDKRALMTVKMQLDFTRAMCTGEQAIQRDLSWMVSMTG